MYIQQQKALLFNDKEKAELIMQATDPKDMKNLGKRINGYIDHIWKEHAKEITMACNREKVYAYPEMQNYLMETGSKQIGEATPDPFFGIGIHIGDPAVVNPREWSGKNLMGQVLTELRSEIVLMKSAILDEPQNDPEPDSSPETVANSEAAKNDPAQNREDSPAHVLILGDSNVKGVSLDMTELDATTHKHCMGGASLSDINALLSQSNLEARDVSAIIIHLGSCNWSADENEKIESGEVIYRDYVEALNACSARFPETNFVLSSVLPRASPIDSPLSHQNKINFEAAKLNRLLKEMQQKEDNIVFVDNDAAFYGADHKVQKDLYVTRDVTGTHLNERGLMILADNLTQGLRSLCR
jgi:ribA/ribD-fused uncharacterized protein